MKRKSFYALGLAAVVALTSNTAAFAAMHPGSRSGFGRRNGNCDPDRYR